jgi:two-component sensor histidine kinase/DNA-binding response OmpR family regulator
LRWLPDTGPEDERVIEDVAVPQNTEATFGQRAHILLVDDNADMRDYIRRLLAPRYEVEAVADGETALAAAARHKPDLVLSDIMMPHLDGMQLLSQLRADPLTSATPIILLSARAGEESRVEGVQAGADDYLIKPFSARELVARVEAHLKMARYRSESTASLRASEERFRAFVAASSDVVYRMSPDWKEMHYLQGQDFIADTVDSSQGWLTKYIHPDDQAHVMGAINKAIETKNMFELEHRVIRVDGTIGWTRSRAIPLLGIHGEIVEWFGAARDITRRKQAEETQKLLVNELDHRVKNTLASVQAIAQQTLRRTRDPEEFVSSFAGRIQSLARAHSLLSAATWRSADLQDVVRDQLLHGSIDESRVTAVGPPLQLQPQMALHLAMMLHELGTNAIKYGSLSTPRGWVTVKWAVEGRTLRLRWEERGGPPSHIPTKRGFGSTLIEQSAKGDGGAACMVVEADGISWDIVLPLAQLMPANGDNKFAAGFVSSKPARQNPQLVQKSSGKLAGMRFLIVEDEPLVALELVDGLTVAGVDVVASVGESKEALDVIESSQFDAALLDGNLNGQRVDEIAAALTRHCVPFAFVSGYGRDSLPLAFREVALLNKPFSQSQVLETAERLITPGEDFIPLRKR